MVQQIDAIAHSGVVQEVFPARNTVRVKVNDENECGGCPAARLCNISGETTNLIEIETPMACRYSKGEEVLVYGTERMHHKAVMLATVIPCIALVAVMILVFLLTFNQLAAALSGIGTMVAFFVILYAVRDKVAHEFTFTIRKKNQGV